MKGLQSILVNKTPLTDTDGNPVIHGVTAVWRAGEQEQTPPEGFESSGAETGLGGSDEGKAGDAHHYVREH